MAEQEAQRAPRMVRIPVVRPLVSALSVVTLGAALLVGGGTANAPAGTALSTVPAAPPDAPSTSRPVDWDAMPRDLVLGDRTSSVMAGSVVAVGDAWTRSLEVVSLAAAIQPLVDPGPVQPRAGLTNVPDVLWQAYRSAAASAPSSCHIPVQLLAAIGQVESGSLAGRGLDAGHRAVPAVLGPVLDGGSFAAIFDTDDGRYDGDTIWDRAVGPMQFIPSTWQRWGRDGNADGTRDPQNVEDAAWSAAAYLCAGGRDLSTTTGLRSAILSYNHSGAYLADVLRLMSTVSPGGGLRRSVATLQLPPSPLVGPPSVPPVRAAAAPRVLSSSSITTPRAATTATAMSTGAMPAPATMTPGASTTSVTSSTTTSSTTTSSTTTSTTTTSTTTSTTSTTSSATSPIPASTSPTTGWSPTSTSSAAPPVTTTSPPTSPSPSTSTSVGTATACPVTTISGTTTRDTSTSDTSTGDPSPSTPPVTGSSPTPSGSATAPDVDPCATQTSTAAPTAAEATGAPVVATTTSSKGPGQG